MGVTGPLPVSVTGNGWLADPVRWDELRRQLAEVVAAHARRDPLAAGLLLEAARAALRLPDRALVEALARLPAPDAAQARVRLDGGYLRLEEPSQSPRELALPPRVLAGVRAVLTDLAASRSVRPESRRLRELGLDARAIAAAARAGRCCG